MLILVLPLFSACIDSLYCLPRPVLGYTKCWFLSVLFVYFLIHFCVEIIGSASRADVSWDPDQSRIELFQRHSHKFPVSYGSVDGSCVYRSFWVPLSTNPYLWWSEWENPLDWGIWILRAPSWLYVSGKLCHFLKGQLVGGSISLGGDFESLFPCPIPILSLICVCG